MSATFSPLYVLEFLIEILTFINRKIFKIPVLEGLILTFLIINFELFDNINNDEKRT